MSESTTAVARPRFSPCAGLAAIGIRQRVRIAQKAVQYPPADKRYDAFIAMLAGAHGLAEINPRRRSAAALQAAFGRRGCAEQSVVRETPDACTAENVRQMEQ